MLHVIIVNFPSKNVDEQSETLFVELVFCLANDEDSRVRSMTGAAIKKLFGCVSSRSLDYILEDTLSWYSGETQRLLSAVAQEIWEAICTLLLHPHMWLRHISTRLIALHFPV